MKTICFLYSEVLGYTEACVNKLIELDVKPLVVHWQLEKLSKYEVKNEKGIEYLSLSNYTAADLIKILVEKRVDGIYMSGWMDKKYLKVAKYFKSKQLCKIVAGSDNQWTGSVRQQLATTWLGRWWLRQYVDELLIPGAPQYGFASRLGFTLSSISWPEYSCDHDLFSKWHHLENGNSINKTLYCVGRFNSVKGLSHLIKAFKSVSPPDRRGWNLKLFGNGPEEQELRKLIGGDQDISINGFLKPDDMVHHLSGRGVFCMPSLIEPWGVALHEFVSAGFPVIASVKCGAAFHFVRSGFNGFLFDPLKVGELESVLRKVFSLDESALKTMSDNSHHLSYSITPAIWAYNLISRFS